ncbi:MAG: class I SAM-dependent methyltransferase [Theionarchaea archaeon]|nr:class I SAM-dependent methyltransferase [Theionarchaea archaeon]
MSNEYMTDEEYAECFMKFWGIRKDIARLLTEYGLKKGAVVLDIPSGHGLFALEIAKIISPGTVHAIGLMNDVETFENLSRSLQRDNSRLLEGIQYHAMDGTRLGFKSDSFDFVVNFLGFEDINMTRGKEGIMQAVRECARVLRSGGIFQLTLCLEGEEPDEKIAREAFEILGCNALFYPKEYYIQHLTHCGIKVCDERWFHTHRKMTARQAREELSFACTEIPIIFSSYGISTISFDSLWDRLKDRIEAHGMAYYSHLCVLIGEKP